MRTLGTVGGREERATPRSPVPSHGHNLLGLQWRESKDGDGRSKERILLLPTFTFLKIIKCHKEELLTLW